MVAGGVLHKKKRSRGRKKGALDLHHQTKTYSGEEEKTQILRNGGLARILKPPHLEKLLTSSGRDRGTGGEQEKL